MEIIKGIIDSLSPDAWVEEVRRGLFWTAVVSRNCGLASTMLRDVCSQGTEDDTKPRSLSGHSGRQLAELALSSDISDASVGLAAINSLINIDETRVTETNAGDFLIKEGAGKDVSVIGHFPFTDALRKVTRNLWVIEKWSRPGDVPERDGQRYLSLSDIVAISSTTLINHTLTGVLSLCRPGSLKMLLGPTTPMSPVLFEYGFDIVSGSVVTNKNLALKQISEGANFRQLKASGCIRLITMRV
ncbi:MAG: hypothetical protein A4E57_00870 [Syntrophorhabdaceae bacterium PtaU1.Bin034]|jgi:uncharacterized protein (DUF4213/DUF364 family)|nr:MAG: hypothetical protein A4E57_00870 [Syntrophorhabdaceae bacterium PtaU1.Bin034]